MDKTVPPDVGLLWKQKRRGLPWILAVLQSIVAGSLPLLTFPGAARADDGFPLAVPGKPSPGIFVLSSSVEGSKTGTAELREAVNDLAYHLATMTGQKFAIRPVDSRTEVSGPAIIVGRLAEEFGITPDPTPERNAIRVASTATHVFLVGETPSATSNAIYDFLRQLGCDWVMPGKIGEIIPWKAEEILPPSDRQSRPSFAGRNLWYRGDRTLCSERDRREFAEWRRRSRLDAAGESPTLGEGHYWDRLIQMHAEEFARNPEMLALVREPSGRPVRKGPQVESTHPQVAVLFAEDIRQTFRKNGWPKDRPVSFPIGPADGLDFSESAETLSVADGRYDPLTGHRDMTDACVLLGNQILANLGNEYPNVRLGFYNYSVHGDYPQTVTPNPRIDQIFAPISYGRQLGPLSPNSKTWPLYRRIVEQWSSLARKQGNKLAYRGYNWNLAENLLPYSKLQIYGEEIPWYHRMGFISVRIEATKAWAVNGPSDYLLASLLWDCHQDWRSVLRTYCERSFGAGAEAMEKYLLRLTDVQTASGQEAGSFHAIPLIFDQNFVRVSRQDVEQAVDSARRPEEKERARAFLSPLTALEDFLDFHQACVSLDFARARVRFDKIRRDWQSAHDRNSQWVAQEAPGYLETFFGGFLEEGARYSSAPYRIALPLPDQLATQFDPLDRGEEMGFASPWLNDKNFLRTQTWGSTWDAQGLASLRAGSVWYRFRFQPPSRKPHESLGLFVGGVEDEITVWLNGRRVDGPRQGFCVPFVFDLTKELAATKDNVLVLRVHRRSAVNEIGLGGILRPCFLFVGPPILQPPTSAPPAKVLPGGGHLPIPAPSQGSDVSAAPPSENGNMRFRPLHPAPHQAS